MDLFKNFSARKAIAIGVLTMVCLSWLPVLDSKANEQIDDGLKRSLVSFASARALNAVISFAQGTEVSATPFGVGVTLTPGQLLDPINDMVEQFSKLMLVASIAFGIQKILVAIGSSIGISIAFSAIALAWCFLLLKNRSMPAWLTRTLTILLMVRFVIPISLVGTGFLFDEFLARKYQDSQNAIGVTSSQFEAAHSSMKEEVTSPQGAGEKKSTGFLPKLFGHHEKETEAIGAEQKPLDESGDVKSQEKLRFWEKFNPKKQFQQLLVVAETAVEHMITLMVIFILQTIVMPLLLIWALVSVGRGILQPTKETLEWLQGAK